MVLSFCSMFNKSDFVTFTCCCLACWHLEKRENVKWSEFRLVVVLFLISIFYDILWFMLLNFDSEGEMDGGFNVQLRKFSYFMTIFGFLFRVSKNYNIFRYSYYWSCGEIRSIFLERLKIMGN